MLTSTLVAAAGSGLSNETTTNTWDALGRETAVQTAAGTTTMAFDLAGDMTSLTDPDQNTTSWVYDLLNRATSEENALGYTKTFGYDANSNLVKEVGSIEFCFKRRFGLPQARAAARSMAPKWFRFRLRSLIALVTAVAVPFGWFANALHDKRRERRAVATIRQMGGMVWYDRADNEQGTPPGPAWLRKLFGEDIVADVYRVSCRGERLDPSRLHTLARWAACERWPLSMRRSTTLRFTGLTSCGAYKASHFRTQTSPTARRRHWAG